MPDDPRPRTRELLDALRNAETWADISFVDESPALLAQLCDALDAADRERDRYREALERGFGYYLSADMGLLADALEEATSKIRSDAADYETNRLRALDPSKG